MGEKLYSYAVLLHPTEEDRKKKEARSQLIIPPTDWKLYQNEQAVNMAAIAALGKHTEHASLIETAADRLEVAVRPF